MRRVLTSPTKGISQDEAYKYCEHLSRTHYENFTVGSVLIPKAHRKHIYAIYAYCRWVDDLGDEPVTILSEYLAQAGWLYDSGRLNVDISNQAGRLELLDRWQQELEACYTGVPTHPALIALQATIQAFQIPKEPFMRLIEANRMEQKSNRFPTYSDLLFYCDRSANPVGHLFLYLFGYRDKERQQLSDHTCTALQLANFWQDVAKDYRIGRLYLPLEDMGNFGYSEDDLSHCVVNENFRRLMEFEVRRTEELFQRGLPLVDSLQGAARIDVALFTMGGSAVLQEIKNRNYDVIASRPALSRFKKARLFLSTWSKMRLGWRISLD